MNNKSHPLLAQIPLTVSPFISLPSATTLPYTYKTIPSTLPPSSTGTGDKAKYIISSSGHSAHPDEIIASCAALKDYTTKVKEDAERTVTEWEESIKERELAEKRRVAPGWLDSESRLLEPVRKEKQVEVDELPTQSEGGDELDRAFGGLELKKS